MEYIWWFEYQVRHIISKATRPSKCTRENNMHRRAAVSNKLTICEENNYVGWVATDREVLTVRLFVYSQYE
jgi:hypothetical protein